MEKEVSYLEAKIMSFGVLVISIPVLVLIAALFVKQEFKVEKEIVINKPKQVVFDYIKSLENQNSYSIWLIGDSNLQQDLHGIDGTTGFALEWKYVKGNQQQVVFKEKIKNITKGQRIEYELHLWKTLQTDFNSYMITDSVTDSTTRVRWGATRRISYPFNLQRLSMSMEDSIGNYLDKSLFNLKDVLEKK